MECVGNGKGGGGGSASNSYVGSTVVRGNAYAPPPKISRVSPKVKFEVSWNEAKSFNKLNIEKALKPKGTGKVTGYSGKLPNQGTVDAGVTGAPKVDAGKQGKHVLGHNNYDSQKSNWGMGQNGVEVTQQAWVKGKPTSNTDKVRVWDAGKPVGPNGETGVRVHIDNKGNIHGYPVDPRLYLP